MRGDHSVVNGVVRPKSSEVKGKEKEEEGEKEAQENRVTWVEGTVDNEFLGRKSSKSTFSLSLYPLLGSVRNVHPDARFERLFQVCCIFHKSRPFDESSSDESSTDEDEQAAELQRRSRHGSRRKKHHGHGHAEGEECGGERKKGEPNKLDGGR